METDIYIVQPGETLASIAFKLDIFIEELSYLNNITPAEPLVAGQAILIPKGTIVSLGYFQLTNLNDLTRALAEVGPFITYGALFQLPVTADGVFRIPEDTDIEQYVRLLQSYSILPLLVITNLGPERFDPDLARTVMSNEALKKRTILNMTRVLAHYGLAGVNIDFENIYPEDRDLYSSFIYDTKKVLGAEGYLVTLTVPPKDADNAETPAKAAFDYQALGEWADLIFIMTYDWGYMTGPPMAVAPINEVQKALSYAVSKIAPFKIIQGIPLYGYDWQLPFTPGTSARTVNLVDVYHLAQRHSATIDYDPVAQSPNFHYTDEAGKDHIVWFEDARSVGVKYAGARNLALGGVGFWSGQNYPYGFRQNWFVMNDFFCVIHRK